MLNSFGYWLYLSVPGPAAAQVPSHALVVTSACSTAVNMGRLLVCVCALKIMLWWAQRAGIRAQVEAEEMFKVVGRISKPA